MNAKKYIRIESHEPSANTISQSATATPAAADITARGSASAEPSSQASPEKPRTLHSNVFKCALLFEGGSMRAAYTSAVAVKLLEKGIYFDHVYGVSAGSSNTVNYLSRDIRRTRESFTSFIGLKEIGGVKTFLQHKGMLNAHFIYQEAGLPQAVLPFDFATFQANPAKLTVVSFDRDTGEDLYFTKEDMPTLDDLMLCVRASSTLPVLMPAPRVQGRVCYDGGFATGGGLPIERILADGYERMVVVRTRKRGYRKDQSNAWAKWYYWNRPHMRELVPARSQRYNEACDLLDQLEADGRAFVIYADDLTLSGTERDVSLLTQNYEAGYAQITRQWPAFMHYVEAAEK